jgi:hypothetical protein
VLDDRPPLVALDHVVGLVLQDHMGGLQAVQASDEGVDGADLHELAGLLVVAAGDHPVWHALLVDAPGEVGDYLIAVRDDPDTQASTGGHASTVGDDDALAKAGGSDGADAAMTGRDGSVDGLDEVLLVIEQRKHRRPELRLDDMGRMADYPAKSKHCDSM